MAYVIYNDISSTEKGLKVLEMPYSSKAGQIRETTKIPGRPEPLVMLKDNLENKEHTVVFEVSPGADIRDIFSWISGSGKLILSDEPDKYYNAISCEPVKAIRENDIYRIITVVFETGPFAYSVNNEPTEYTSQEIWLTNTGSYYCQPVYKLYGSGNLILVVNNDIENTFTVYNVDEYVTVDAEKLLVHKNGTFLKSKGKLPFLNIGDNRIQTNASKIEITKNERWI